MTAAFWDDEPGPRHDLRCPVNTFDGPVNPDDPEEDCNCRDASGHLPREFAAGVTAKVRLFESYSPQVQAS